MAEADVDLPLPFLPSAPFDDSGADAVLCTSDGVEFHVHRLVLSLASPFFKDMFSLPQPGPGPAVATVAVSESAILLDRVLRFWYPGAEPPITENLDELRDTLEVLILKYDMQSLVPAAKQQLRVFIPKDPVAVFAIACRHEWRDLALEAALCSLRLPIRVFGANRPSQLKYMSADTYHNLLRYHAECAAAAAALTTSLKWASYADIPGAECSNWKDPIACPRMGHCTFAHNTLAPLTSWFSACLDNLGETLAKAPAARLDSPEFLSLAVKEIRACEFCRSDGFPALMKFLGILKSKIEKDISSVKLALDF